MSKCPKCGCEFHENKFATIVVDKDMPPGTWTMGNCTDMDNQPQTLFVRPENEKATRDILNDWFVNARTEAARNAAMKIDADMEAEAKNGDANVT